MKNLEQDHPQNQAIWLVSGPEEKSLWETGHKNNPVNIKDPVTLVCAGMFISYICNSLLCQLMAVTIPQTWQK